MNKRSLSILINIFMIILDINKSFSQDKYCCSKESLNYIEKVVDFYCGPRCNGMGNVSLPILDNIASCFINNSAFKLEHDTEVFFTSFGLGLTKRYFRISNKLNREYDFYLSFGSLLKQYSYTDEYLDLTNIYPLFISASIRADDNTAVGFGLTLLNKYRRITKEIEIEGNYVSRLFADESGNAVILKYSSLNKYNNDSMFGFLFEYPLPISWRINMYEYKNISNQDYQKETTSEKGKDTFPYTIGIGWSNKLDPLLIFGCDFIFRKWSIVEREYKDLKINSNYKDTIELHCGLETYFMRKIPFRVGTYVKSDKNGSNKFDCFLTCGTEFNIGENLNFISSYETNFISKIDPLIKNNIDFAISYKFRDYNGEYRSPICALFIATFPGSLVHGLGHYYAGDNKTGFILFLIEILSIVQLTNISSDYNVIGISGFSLSWIYDIFFSPCVAIKNNKKSKK